MPNYENSRAGAYHVARYVVLPELLATITTEEPFHLLTVAGTVFDRLMSEGKLPGVEPGVVLPDNQINGISMRRLTLWQVDNVVRQQDLLEKVGKGWWRNKSADEADTPIEDEPESIEPVPEYDGWVYAFSFPTLVKSDAPFQIKVGKASDVDSRVAEQTRGSAFFERAVILGRWQANRVNSVERAIHDVLKARGKWLDQAPGAEWFLTTIAEVEEIVGFIQKK